MKRATWQRILIEVVIFAALLPAAARADSSLFSPGPLSAVHQKLDSPDSCLKCHAAGGRVAMARCFDCHTDVKQSVDNKKGLHGHIALEKISCDNCHHEHLGVESNLLPWRADKSDFDHRSTGWPLRGAHARVPCDECHPHPKANTNHNDYTGASPQCDACHFDEHRGQLESSCDNCHSERAWRPTPGFDHDEDSNYPLTGKHRDVLCAKCHPSLRDTTTPTRAKPKAVSFEYAKYKGLAYGSCKDCHQDPHKGKLGANCASCHTTKSWFVIVGGAKDTGFHARTRYPLEGMHASVPCKSCHGPWGKEPAIYRGLKFAACDDCHIDSHEGQLDGPKGRAPKCDVCHTVEGFMPPNFDIEAHQKTDYPLEGAHMVTACNLCHVRKISLLQRIRPAVRDRMRHEGRDVVVSLAELRIDKPLQRCDSCHLDPHAGQFASRAAAGCADCHNVNTFHKVNFNHNKESRFPLTGAHATTACGGCHISQTFDTGDTGVLYKPLDMACSSCHRDVHLGQFADPNGVTACERCHATQTFKESPAFNHNDPNDARFPLEGAHMALKCGSCHPKVQVDKRTAVDRYKPVPVACEGCHEDYHNGTLDNLPVIDPNTGVVREAAQPGTACARCHTASGWLPATFPEHAAAGFPLNGAHGSVPCSGCHLRDFKATMNTMCESCHRDAHAGEFGSQCSACHNEDNWQAEFDVQAHRLTNFPLTGAHGAIPCQECHVGFFSRDFRGTTVECIGCHQGDYLRAGTVSVNHVTSGFSLNCRECHDPWAFQRGRLADHDFCFPISSGVHAGIYCADCHTSVAGLVDNLKCSNNTENCTGCHTHSRALTDPQHAAVANYVYANASCYACHPRGI